MFFSPSLSKIITLFLGVFLLVSLVRCSSKEINNPEGVVATVNGYKITLEEWQNEKNFMTAYLPSIQGDQELANEKTDNAILEQLITIHVMLEEADRKNIQLKDAEITTAMEKATSNAPGMNMSAWLDSLHLNLEDWLARLKQNLVLQKLVEQEVNSKIQISDQEIISYYNAHKSDFITEEMRSISHIQVRSGEVAQLVMKEIQKKRPFDKLVNAFSNASDRANQGNLGLITAHSLPNNLSNAVFSISKIGGVVQVENPYGFHIFKLEEIKPASKLSWSEAKPKIISLLSLEKRKEEFLIWYKNLEKSAKIDRYPNTLKNSVDFY